jgi:hypothetical protein
MQVLDAVFKCTEFSAEHISMVNCFFKSQSMMPPLTNMRTKPVLECWLLLSPAWLLSLRTCVEAQTSSKLGPYLIELRRSNLPVYPIHHVHVSDWLAIWVSFTGYSRISFVIYDVEKHTRKVKSKWRQMAFRTSSR